MADQIPSVEIKWGKKDEVKFAVKATKLREAGDLLNKREEWGRFEGHIDYYNFCRKHETIKMTPAQASGLADKQWSVLELLERVA